MAYKYKVAMTAGVWDQFHPGHREVIKKGTKAAEKFYILVLKGSVWYDIRHGADNMQPFEQRLQQVKNFIKELGIEDRVILDIDGADEVYTAKAVSECPDDIEAFFLSTKDETVDCVQGLVKKTMDICKDKGKPPFKMVYIPVKKDKDGNAYSASRIRAQREIAKEK